MSGKRKRETEITEPVNRRKRVSAPPNFLAVKYKEHKAAVPRSPDYQEMITAIKTSFPRLETALNDRILIFARLEEFDDHVQITQSIWANLLPRLSTIRVELDDGPPALSITPGSSHEVSNYRVVPSTEPRGPQFLVAGFEGDKATIPRDANYQKTVAYIRQAFPRSCRAPQIILNTRLEQFGGVVLITEELWSSVLPGLMLIEVELEYSRWELIHVHVEGRSRYYEVDLNRATVEDLKSKVQAAEGIPSQEQHLWFSEDQANPRTQSYYSELKSGGLLRKKVDGKCTLLVLNEVASAELAKDRIARGCSARRS
ncbi:unnamed protein product [Rhizoctonia solani]|uniref:Ubiquitin-like domain-containing protein n=1 Tax=Rhizoctonia solani TaxID=456999 RepID=A0A8H3BDU7_9AGAM|nr:unnamed protein product [Rhizoctonia solani]